MSFLFSGGCSAEPYRPLQMGTDTVYAGYISSGSKFGVKIGDNRSIVKSKLEGKSKYSNKHRTCSYRVHELIGCDQGTKLDYESYRVQWPLRDGMIFVIYENSNVSRLAWEFAYFERI